MFSINENTIVIATTNKGKLKEIRKDFDPFNCGVISQEDLNIESIPETGYSFKSNALQKAVHLASYTNYPIIADDSGLVVDALNGEPGIYSARYAGDKANDNDNIDLLLDRMAQKKNRNAYFHCSLIYLNTNDISNPISIETQWHGTICMEKLGTEGFGYDPIFFIPELGKTAAELSIYEKNKYSHRGKAMTQLIERLTEDKLITYKES
tara:strand:+ start:6428 stop:7054 length:627 start_codon:yes stop_codon:yes gene_type:complete